MCQSHDVTGMYIYIQVPSSDDDDHHHHPQRSHHLPAKREVRCYGKDIQFFSSGKNQRVWLSYVCVEALATPRGHRPSATYHHTHASRADDDDMLKTPPHYLVMGST